MTNSTNAGAKPRYRLYFPLMDACLFFSIVGFGDFIIHRVFGTEIVPMDVWWGLSIGIVVMFFNAVVTPFLIVARFLRDEYAEQLWRRTSIVLVYFIAVMPLLLIIGDWVSALAFGGTEPVGFFKLMFESTDWFGAMHFTWLIFGVLFVVIFELLRFLDSRA